MVLADFGADVVKIEPPGGDPFRAVSSAPVWLRGKRSVVLDLTTESRVDHLHELLRGADVAIASWAPGDAAIFGADYQTVAAINPNLVYCSLTGWGSVGPYANYPASQRLVAAKSGRMLSFRGQVRRPGPAFTAVEVGTHASAHAAIHGILAALLARDRMGQGQLVETSLLQGMLPYDFGLLRTQLVEQGALTLGPEAIEDQERMPTLNYHPVLTKDGEWIQLGNILDHLFYSFVLAADITELIVGEQFQGDVSTWPVTSREEARDIILQKMRERTADDWMRTFHQSGNIAAEPFLTTEQGLQHVDVVSNGGSVETDDPRLGLIRQPGLVARLEQTPGEVGAPYPDVGAHTDEVLAEARGAPRQEVQVIEAPLAHPLEGVTILEFATIIAAPLGVSFLGDLGARVIKVEPMGGDPSRGRGTDGIGIIASKFNVSKESIYVDLKTPEGREIVEGLLRNADVVVHNYRPGVPERLGIGYEQARAANPRVVWISANGYGPDGPSAHRPAAHPIPGAAMGGALYQAGAGMPPPGCESVAEMREAARILSRANEANPDPNTSAVIATAAMLGIVSAKRFGIGQRIFVDMLTANIYANYDDAIDHRGKKPRRLVDRELFGLSALERLYPAQSGWVYLEATSEDAWRILCAAVGQEGLLDDPRFASSDARDENDLALASILGDAFVGREADEWERVLTARGVACVRADAGMPGEFLAHDPHVAANGFVVEVDHDRFGRYRRHGPLVTLSRTPGRLGAGALGGADTDAILGELGYDAETIDGLRRNRIVGSEQVEPLRG